MEGRGFGLTVSRVALIWSREVGRWWRVQVASCELEVRDSNNEALRHPGHPWFSFGSFSHPRMPRSAGPSTGYHHTWQSFQDSTGFVVIKHKPRDSWPPIAFMV